MAYGFVYILSNEIMPDIYKIGYTDKSPMQRCYELSSKTAVPMPYQVVCYGEVDNAYMLEQRLHQNYNEFRINDSREFFRLTYNDIFDLHNILKEDCDNFTECQRLNEIIYCVLGH